MFEVLGLSPLAETVYLTILRHPESDLESIGNELGIDDVVLRSALDHLASMSLLREFTLPGAGYQGSGPTLEPVPAEIGLARLLAQEQADVARRQQQIEESSEALQSLIESRPSRMSSGAGCGVEHLNGVTEVSSKLAEIAETCEWEVCSFMPRGAQSEERRQTTLRLDERAIDRGVRLRTIYLDSVRNDPANLKYASWLSERGSEVRTVPVLPLRMLVVDRRTALVPVDAEESGDRAIVLSENGVVVALGALFNLVWRGATPLNTTRPRDEGSGRSAQETQALKLLALGHTDSVIARRLGVSPRTARRLAADLLSALGARSRFQAGAIAALRGWIDDDDLAEA